MTNNNKIISELKRLPQYKQIDNATKYISGLNHGARAMLMASIFEDSSKSILLLCPNEPEALEMSEAIKYFYSGSDEIRLFSEYNVIPFSGLSPSKDVMDERVKTLNDLLSRKKLLVCTSVKAISKRIVSKETFSELCLTLNKADVIDAQELRAHLTELGYVEVQSVEEYGEFAYKGGIIDIFSYAQDKPVRIELFDEEIESLRFFSPESQRSTAITNKFTISPARDSVYLSSMIEDSILSNPDISDELKQKFELSHYFAGCEHYISMIYGREKPQSLLSYMPPDTGIFISTERAATAAYTAHTDSLDIQLKSGDMHKRSIFEEYLDEDEFADILKSAVKLENLPKGVKSEVLLSFIESKSFKADVKGFLDYIDAFLEGNYYVNLVTGYEEQANRFAQMLEQFSPIITNNDKQMNISGKNLCISVGHLNEGFVSDEMKTVVLSDTEVFGRQKKRKIRKPTAKKSLIESFIDLNEGDYVVHINHGIGLYKGLIRLSAAGTEKDYLKIEYAGADKLYIPVEQMNFVQKYLSASTGAAPKLDKLGGKAWEKVRARAKKSAEDLARELIKISSVRSAHPGISFPKDTAWQDDFEALFPYQETPDQLRAVSDIKQDMEDSTAMDRLVCGDVGFGKTEVALRAIFKAVMSGKQAAILCPTTVLSQQHFLTARERFKEFPIKIDLMNRFRNSTELSRIKKSVNEGSTDLLVGTHKILSKQLEFKNLGLLVIDEEQRFGVKHKEALKKYKTIVDVLTLSATPIPRTLNMALMKLRDISVIETPPLNRLPVQTYVTEFNQDLMKDAIQRELRRGGQVFVVYNRVESIEQFSGMTGKLCPEAVVDFAHGQMEGRRLEKKMLDFINKEFNVLVATTIIENGIDIPNCNTIIIYRADMLGLSELYQLRGRVGRSDRDAYAYFFYPEDREITPNAVKRLKAIGEHTDLGSGFKVAMKDLEIRGAGNILGREQSGQMHSVGYELYTQLLEEAVAEMKGEKLEVTFDTVVDIKHDLFIPDTYIQDSKQKIQIYKSILKITSNEDARSLSEDLIDRFGKIPKNVKKLIAVAELKAKLKALRVISVIEGEYNFYIKLDESSLIDSKRVAALVSQEGSGVYIDKNDFNQLLVPIKEKSIDIKLKTLNDLMDKIKHDGSDEQSSGLSDAVKSAGLSSQKGGRKGRGKAPRIKRIKRDK